MRALRRHEEGSARVVPVILRPCDWQSSPFGKLQALPRDGQPVKSFSNVDTALTAVALALRALADEIRSAVATSSPPAISPLLSASAQQKRSDDANSGNLPNAAHLSVSAAAASSKGSSGQATSEQGRRLKIGAIKIWFLEFGPFELAWPAQISTRLIVSGVLAAAVLGGIAYYWVILKQPLDDARNLMRRAEYAGAVTTIESMPKWSTALPWVASLAAQAAFGAKLANGQDIRDLSPELKVLGDRYPNAPDVLLFQGSKAYYDQNPESLEKARQQFTEAANRDSAHVEAHFLAADRNIDMAYTALSQGDTVRAQSSAAEAHRLIARALSQSSFADTLPRYANWIGELDELEGDNPAAYDVYSKLAPRDPPSALQAAFVSWRLPELNTQVKRSLESIEAAINRLAEEPANVVATVGWSLRVSAIEAIPVRSKEEKLCLLALARDISNALQSTLTATPGARSSSLSADRASSVACGDSAAADRSREIACVEVLNAQRAVSPSDTRQKVLEDWRTTHLRCGQELQPLPVLPSRGPDAKRTALGNMVGEQYELEST